MVIQMVFQRSESKANKLMIDAGADIEVIKFNLAILPIWKSL